MKDTFYFSHDYNSHNDPKILKLRRIMNLEGYGIFWCIVELLAQDSNHKLLLSGIEDIAYELRTECERITNVIQDYDLFENDGKYFWSNRLISHFKDREEKSLKARESAQQRWKNANALQTQYDGNAIKERKGKERKLNIYSISDFSENSISYYILDGFIKLGYSPKGTKEEFEKWCIDLCKLNLIKFPSEIKEIVDEWVIYWKSNGKTIKNHKTCLLNSPLLPNNKKKYAKK